MFIQTEAENEKPGTAKLFDTTTEAKNMQQSQAFLLDAEVRCKKENCLILGAFLPFSDKWMLKGIAVNVRKMKANQ